MLQKVEDVAVYVVPGLRVAQLARVEVDRDVVVDVVYQPDVVDLDVVGVLYRVASAEAGRLALRAVG